MSSMLGDKLRLSVFGQSHSRAIGVVIDGLPAGETIDLEEVSAFMTRRAPGRTATSTTRKENDLPIVLSGLVDGKTCGAPLCAMIENHDARSKDYEALRVLPRPSHADYTAYLKWGENHDIRGGGAFSGRLTAPLCFAGAVCAQILARQQIFCGAHIASIGGIADAAFDPVLLKKDALLQPGQADFPVIDCEKGRAMQALIEQIRSEGDSIGGIIECAAVGVPGGLGQPMFDGMENRLAKAIFGIPAVRGLEFGDGFAAAAMRGSRHNDPFLPDENGALKTISNHHGGILGGITSGMPLLFRAAVKPTPSIALPQQSVNLKTHQPETLVIDGRHDPCIVPRAVPCVEAVTSFILLDSLIQDR